VHKEQKWTISRHKIKISYEVLFTCAVHTKHDRQICLKSVIFWDGKLCSLREVYQHFKGYCCNHHQIWWSICLPTRWRQKLPPDVNSIISHKTVIFITTTKRMPIPTLGLLLLSSKFKKHGASTMYSCTLPDKKYEDSYLHSYHHKNPKTNFKSTAVSSKLQRIWCRYMVPASYSL
jgi:hypothetical protein